MELTSRRDWTASTDNIDGEVTVSATSTEGHALSYVFSGRERFIKSLLWTDNEVDHLEMNLNQENEYTGDVFFIVQEIFTTTPTRKTTEITTPSLTRATLQTKLGYLGLVP